MVDNRKKRGRPLAGSQAVAVGDQDGGGVAMAPHKKLRKSLPGPSSTSAVEHRLYKLDGPLLAQSRHDLVHRTCPLSGAKRTSPGAIAMSANDRKRPSCRGRGC